MMCLPLPADEAFIGGLRQFWGADRAAFRTGSPPATAVEGVRFTVQETTEEEWSGVTFLWKDVVCTS